MKAFLSAVLIGLSPTWAGAQEVGECDWRAAAQMIAEPWESNTRLFANGEVRLTIMDAGEPAAGSFHLMILSPPYDEAGRHCAILSLTKDAMGFAGLSMEGATAQYDPATGLSVTLPASRWIPDSDTYIDAILTVTINQESGAITGKLD
jgi:hypothetical protein